MDVSTSTSSPTSEVAQSLYEFVPDTPLCRSAFDIAVSRLTLPLLHHSLRVFILASWLAEKENSPYASDDGLRDILFVASICHDFGATHHHDGEQRFEVEGADGAADLLRGQGGSQSQVHDVWVAVALHTSPGIAERIHPLARLIRLGVLLDFRPATRTQLDAEAFATGIDKKVPRLDIEKVLGDAVVQQALTRKQKAPPASWAGVLLRSHLENPDWTGVNKAF